MGRSWRLVDGVGIVGGDCGRLGFRVAGRGSAASLARRAGSGLGRAVVILGSPLKTSRNREDNVRSVGSLLLRAWELLVFGRIYTGSWPLAPDAPALTLGLSCSLI
jgi:hypothetical protein